MKNVKNPSDKNQNPSENPSENASEKSDKNAKNKAGEKNLARCEKKCDFMVCANCYNVGRIVEYCKKRGCAIWDITAGEGKASFCVGKISQPEILEIVKKCGGENPQITNVSRRAKLKARMPFFVGILVFCLCLAISNMFIFKVEARGDCQATKVHVENMAKEIFPFASLKNEGDMQMLKSQLSACEDIAFFSVEVCQNRLIINFLKSENAVVIEKSPNVLAPENGVLISLSTLSGIAKKSVGDVVFQGDILIEASPQVDFPCASGSGVLKVKKSETYTLPILLSQSVATGEIQRDTYLKICEFELLKKPCEFAEFSTTKKSIPTLFPNVEIVSETRRGLEKNTISKSAEELQQIAVDIFKSQFSKEFAYNISEIKTSSEWAGESCVIVVECEYLVHFAV